MFNDSYRKRYIEYIKMIISMVISFAIVWILNMFQYYGIIPDYINNFLIVGVISIGIIISYNIYSNIQRHDLLNYDELAIKSPELYDPSKISTLAPTTIVSVNPAVPTCALTAGASLCGIDTQFDSKSGKCVATKM
jgi:hypothetical protein